MHLFFREVEQWRQQLPEGFTATYSDSKNPAGFFRFPTTIYMCGKLACKSNTTLPVDDQVIFFPFTPELTKRFIVVVNK